jgi:DNA helicase IV
MSTIKVNLILHDSFLDAFSNLPRKIQKKTRELMKKFKLDPTSSAINYEKISTFSDQSLRTIRVDQKYRAIIKAPETGSNYHLLWVDNHDEAMDWAKNKIFQWNDNTQSFQLFDKPLHISHIAEQQTKALFADYSDQQLLELGTPQEALATLRNVTSQEELKSIQNNLPVDNFEYLFFLADGIDLEEILEEIQSGKNDEDQEASNNARKHIYLLTDDEEIDKVLSGDFDKWKVFLHPSQRKLAFSKYNGPVKVTGGAGTGKTVCAMHRAKYLTENLDLFAKPVLFTTYTKSLTNYLEKTIQDLGIDPNHLHITNIDKLIFDLARNTISENIGFLTDRQELTIWSEVLEYNPTDKTEEFLMTEYQEVILSNNVQSAEQYYRTPRTGRTIRIGRKDKTEIWSLVQDFKARKAQNYSKLELCNLLTTHFTNQLEKPYSHIICDEIQDFTNNELSLLRSLVKQEADDMFLVGDPYQNIYTRKINFSKSGINVRGKRSKKLKINYRTTEQIKMLALKTVARETFDNFDGEEENSKGYVSLMQGDDPRYTTFNTPEQQDQFYLSAIKQLISDGIAPQDICVCARTNYAVDQIKTTLNKHNLKYDDISITNRSDDHLILSSFHNMKGHEFKFVIVVGLSNSTVPYKHMEYQNYTQREKNEYEKQERSLYYVVFSRAIQGLFITGIGQKSDWF